MNCSFSLQETDLQDRTREREPSTKKIQIKFKNKIKIKKRRWRSVAQVDAPASNNPYFFVFIFEQILKSCPAFTFNCSLILILTLQGYLLLRMGICLGERKEGGTRGTSIRRECWTEGSRHEGLNCLLFSHGGRLFLSPLTFNFACPPLSSRKETGGGKA